MLDLTASVAGLEAMSAAVGQTGTMARESVKAALRDLRKQVLSVTKKETATEVGVAQKAVRTRWISDPVSGPNGLRVWVGTNPLPVGALGKPRQIKAGAKAGRRHFYPRAFVATMPSGHKSIFMRKSSDAYDPARYRGTRYEPAKPWSRLPIAEALGPDIHEPVVRSFDANRTKFEEIFRNSFFDNLTERMNGGT